MRNDRGMHVELCNFGARILSIKVPDKDGKLLETTLNQANDEDIISDKFYMGASIGRTCNRISNSQFSLDGVEFSISTNDGVNNLHGGEVGFSKRIWHTKGTNVHSNSLTFELHSQDGDQGYPGAVDAQVLFTLNEKNELRLDFSATSTKPTPINFCNHAYFNMGEKNISNLELRIQADTYIPVDAESIPLGYFDTVVNTRFDFNESAVLADRLMSGTFDHCYHAKNTKMATLTSRKHKISLEVESDQVGIQFYSGNFLPTAQSALCLEAQGYPDAINHQALDQDILRPGELYQKYVIYRYSHFS
ncbi:aldose epimerase family protein [Brumicola pallidula]|uniref:aldose epimerase family protein n=1 Tax=Brumicola pallidula TaxID=56807 RepID=UPI00130E05B3|nr:aldose epimerase family protein [Glaciecola pallidula]